MQPRNGSVWDVAELSDVGHGGAVVALGHELASLSVDARRASTGALTWDLAFNTCGRTVAVDGAEPALHEQDGFESPSPLPLVADHLSLTRVRAPAEVGHGQRGDGASSRTVIDVGFLDPWQDGDAWVCERSIRAYEDHQMLVVRSDMEHGSPPAGAGEVDGKGCGKAGKRQGKVPVLAKAE